MNIPDCRTQRSQAKTDGLLAREVCSRPSPKSTLGNRVSYHNRNVPTFSTIEMSPGCSFTMPTKKPVFSCAASLVAKDDSAPAEGYGAIFGDGGAGEGAAPLPLEKPRGLLQPEHFLQLPHRGPSPVIIGFRRRTNARSAGCARRCSAPPDSDWPPRSG